MGLLIYGRMVEWTYPGYGKQQRARILAALSQAKPGEHAVFKELGTSPYGSFLQILKLCLLALSVPKVSVR